MSDVVPLVPRPELDQQVLDLRLSGHSICSIGRQFKLSDKQVCESLDRVLPLLDNETRARVLKEEIARLDVLTAPYFEKAKLGDDKAAMVLIKISERRASLLGLDAPQSVTAVLVSPEATAVQGTVTDRIEARLNQIRTRKLASIEDPDEPPSTLN